ncbi:MAG: primosomal protein N' [Proteobacteria bacterium]|nr:MAG: primosomal protein N' [Pseudomonadota bacterium]
MTPPPAAPSYVSVALPVPLHNLFTYRLPPSVSASPGSRVRVPFGRRQLIGLVLDGPLAGPPASAAGHIIRDVIEVLDGAPIVTPSSLRLARWLSDYYLAPPGEACALLLPPRMSGGKRGQVKALAHKIEEVVHLSPPRPCRRRLGPRMQEVVALLEREGPLTVAAVRARAGVGRGVVRRLEAAGRVRLEARRVHRDPFHAEAERDTAPPLTDEQRGAVAQITAGLGGFRGYLLHGVTGSGKTEVYLAVIGEALERGLGALVLVPEIALTPQLVARFRARLGERVAVQHSGLDPSARQEQWQRVRDGELPVVIGARSALFAPLPRLGVVIVDEEHEASFKQDTSPRYHARDLALVRGSLEGAPVVLGSATPSAESWANVDRGKLERIALAGRVHARPLPDVEVVDLRAAAMADIERLFSVALLDAVRETVAAGQQVILFVNRRGFSSFILCRECGHTLDCPACSVTFTWHRRRGRLVCHLCDQSQRRPRRCPSCSGEDLAEMGFGTELVEARVQDLVPGARVARMDRDTTRGRALTRLLDDFRAHEVDVLIGTQMVAKGHDFPNVTLVGVLLAEQGLGFPDFRASERTFQLLTQIAGRAGRAELAGRVIVQTYTPAHYAIRHAVDHDAHAFLDEELPLRRVRGFPPATYLALFRLSGTDLTRVTEAARGLGGALLIAARPLGHQVTVLHPQPAPIERIKHRFRFQVLVNARRRGALRQVLEATREAWSDGRFAGVQIGLDVDPMTFV